MIWCYPCSPCSYFSRTYCDLWYRWVYSNDMDTDEWKSNMQDMQEGAYPKKKKKSVPNHFVTVKYRSETYWWTIKTKQGRLRGTVDKYCNTPTSGTGWVVKHVSEVSTEKPFQSFTTEIPLGSAWYKEASGSRKFFTTGIWRAKGTSTPQSKVPRCVPIPS